MLGNSTPRTTKNGESAIVSSGSGGATSVTASVFPVWAAISPNAVVSAWAGPAPPARATSRRGRPPESIRAPSTAPCAIPDLAAASLS
jgi:hypothetical protein